MTRFILDALKEANRIEEMGYKDNKDENHKTLTEYIFTYGLEGITYLGVTPETQVMGLYNINIIRGYLPPAMLSKIYLCEELYSAI